MAATTASRRDYSVGGTEEARAFEAGLVEADWYGPAIDPQRLQELSRRRNGPAASNAGLYFTLLIGSGVIAWVTWWSWWTVPALFVYATLYGSSGDARWHECGHGTAFKTTVLNDIVYALGGFMVMREPTIWRWSHTRHHSDSIIVGRDPEITSFRPAPSMLEWFSDVVSWRGAPIMMGGIFRRALGRLTDGERNFVPEHDHKRVVAESRVFVAIWAGLALWCVLSRSLVPLAFFVGPSFYGVWFAWLLGNLQHAGLQEDVLDHRLNSRTVYLNPVFRFLYWNMNYHIEHHLFPQVPAHALPALHEEIKAELPPTNTSLFNAYRDIIHSIRMQHRDPAWEAERPLPVPARPEVTQEALVFRPGPAGDDGWVDVCALDNVEVGQVARVDLADDRTVALYRLSGGVYATSGICTHSRRVHLAGGFVIDGQIECPKHNGRFDIATGQPTRAPACEALECYNAEVRDERIWLAVGAAAQPGDGVPASSVPYP